MINIDKKLYSIKEEIINNRRELHQIPEIGFEEYKTNTWIVKKLKEYGIQVHTNIVKTGVIGYLKGTEGKQTLAFRADMDGLPVQEKTDLDYKSQHPGFMHACGHDGHMAIVLGLAKLLSQNKEKLKDNIVFLFQPAEEGPGGAQPIVESGIIEKFKIDKIIGLHIYPDIEEGRIGCRAGAFLARTGEFDITVQGQSGHGAIPQSAKDSIVIASHLISAYQSIVSRNTPPIEAAVLTIGRMWAGERRNVIAGEAVLEGTIRSFNDEVYNYMKSRMISISKGLEISYDCKINIDFWDMYPAVKNDEDMVKTLIKAIGHENTDIVDPQMIAEDFAYYREKTPSLFFLLGSRNEEKGYIYPLHNCRFNFNEDILLTGVQVYINLIRTMGGL